MNVKPIAINYSVSRLYVCVCVSTTSRPPFFLDVIRLSGCLLVASCCFSNSALQLFATIMDTAEAQTASTSRHTAAGLASASGYGDVEGVGSDHGGGIAVVGRSRDCYMAAITACQKSEDFPRALALLQHMRRKVKSNGTISVVDWSRTVLFVFDSFLAWAFSSIFCCCFLGGFSHKSRIGRFHSSFASTFSR